MIEFIAYGRAEPRGSKKAMKSKHMKFAAVVDDNPNSKPWMEHVRHLAAQQHTGELLRGPIRLTVTFYFAYMASHYGTGRNAGVLKNSAPERVSGGRTGDIDKLVRGVADGLTGSIYRDDKQVCELIARKYYTAESERTVIRVEAIA